MVQQIRQHIVSTHLFPLHFYRQGPVGWVKVDPWDHDGIACRKKMNETKEIVLINIINIITLVWAHSDFGIDESVIEGSNDVSCSVNMASGGIQISDEHDWSSNLQGQDMGWHSVD